jgi:cytochrome c peroxidase
MRTRYVCLSAIVSTAVILTLAANVPADGNGPNMVASENASGQARTFSAKGAIDFDNPFFQDLGNNGRRCVTCHDPGTGWTITPAAVQQRFAASEGTDPIFSPNDGSNCEGAATFSLPARRDAYSLLLSRGVIRVGLDVPAGAEFFIDSVADPYHCGRGSNDASLYRRPLPSTNLGLLSAVMWDGRESTPTTTILEDLAHQANDATRGHAQAGQDLTPAQIRRIVEFESSLFTSQARDAHAGNLDARGANGGPMALSHQRFFIGINDPVGLNPTGAAFDARAFSLFDAWMTLRSSDDDPFTKSRSAIARGEAIFNTKAITISGVAGLNGQTFSSGVSVPASVTGTCTTCHDSPNAGGHSVKAPLNIGIADPATAPYLPVYTLRNLATLDVIRTTDPGRAMISGKWSDIGKFKGPILRGLAARAPYFHNGAAETLEQVVDFYELRFNIGLTPQEKADLAAFLRAL